MTSRRSRQASWLLGRGALLRPSCCWRSQSARSSWQAATRRRASCCPRAALRLALPAPPLPRALPILRPLTSLAVACSGGRVPDRRAGCGSGRSAVRRDDAADHVRNRAGPADAVRRNLHRHIHAGTDTTPILLRLPSQARLSIYRCAHSWRRRAGGPWCAELDLESQPVHGAAAAGDRSRL